MATTATMAMAMVKETDFVTATVTVKVVVTATTTWMTTTSAGKAAEALGRHVLSTTATTKKVASRDRPFPPLS